jgi:hypothetical protein
MSRIHRQIKTHPLTCAPYNHFEVLHLDHIGPLRPDAKGNMFILVIIDAFSRWVELYPTATTTALQTASRIFQHFGRFGTPELVHKSHHVNAVHGHQRTLDSNSVWNLLDGEWKQERPCSFDLDQFSKLVLGEPTTGNAHHIAGPSIKATPSFPTAVVDGSQ